MSNLQYIQSTPPRRVEAEITNPGAIGGSTGGATEAKQDTQIVAIQSVENAITAKDIMTAVRVLLQAITYPPHLDRSQNRERVTAAIESGTVTTVSTVSTVSNISTIDSYQGRMLMLNQNNMAWHQLVRSRLT